MHRKILIVEDDRDILKLLTIRLQRKGFEIASATTGDEALEKLSSSRPDLILLDVRIPSPDGYEVIRRIRREPQWAGIPVIFSTAEASVGESAASHQADDYLVKPFEPYELYQKIDRFLN
jgi:DNA-binding response OmpR family regulator